MTAILFTIMGQSFKKKKTAALCLGCIYDKNKQELQSRFNIYKKYQQLKSDSVKVSIGRKTRECYQSN